MSNLSILCHSHWIRVNRSKWIGVKLLIALGSVSMCRETRHADGLFTSGYSKLLGQLSARRYLESLIGKRVRYMDLLCRCTLALLFTLHDPQPCRNQLKVVCWSSVVTQVQQFSQNLSRNIKPHLNSGNQLEDELKPENHLKLLIETELLNLA